MSSQHDGCGTASISAFNLSSVPSIPPPRKSWHGTSSPFSSGARSSRHAPPGMVPVRYE